MGAFKLAEFSLIPINSSSIFENPFLIHSPIGQMEEGSAEHISQIAAQGGEVK